MKLTEKEFLERELEMGINPDNARFVNLAKKTVNQIKDLSHLKAIDFGAGVGVYSNEFQKAGFDIVAQDISKAHRDFIKKSFFDLKVIAKPVKADLMLFIEVAEHMTDEEIVKAIEAIDPKYILFSSTSKKTDQDFEWGHVNIKSKTEWITFWESMSYKVKHPLKYPTSWTMLLERI
jgi:2-polyprenyl-3-methyl-5-hydroxy-6-metoxy-1,4-benzoquinol methylase